MASYLFSTQKPMNIKYLKNSFKNKALLEEALTHKSWLNESGPNERSYERLEFLGDAVLELVVSETLFNRYPDKQEGVLTLARSSIVNNKGNLAVVAQKLNLGSSLRLGKGEEAVGGRKKLSILADVVEAIIGALYLDQGIGAASEFIYEHILKELPENIEEELKDPKTYLQEKVQAQGHSVPKYRVIEESGPDHDKTFTIAAVVNEIEMGRGSGSSKLEAEKSAAAQALEKLET